MEGDLYQQTLFALKKPQQRILFAEEARSPKRQREEARRLANRMKVARKFDIDDELLEMVFEQPSWVELTKNVGKLPVELISRNIVEANRELRLPFNSCFLEFNGRKFNEHLNNMGWSTAEYVSSIGDSKTPLSIEEDSGRSKKPFDRIGVLFLQSNDGTIDCYCFHNSQDPLENYKGHTDWVYMSMVGRSFREATLAGNPNADAHAYALKQMSLLVFGMSFEGQPLTDAVPEYIDMLRRTKVVFMQHLFRYERIKEVLDDLVEPWCPFLIRVAWETLRVLNYPWVAKERTRFEGPRKGRRPKITPRDSYYRCKINLPKPDGVETKDAEPRDEASGKRLHQVRGHWRVYRDENGDFIKRTWIKEHRRGDHRLGVVLKDYVLTKVDDQNG